MAIDKDIQELLVLGDSDLLIHQVQGEWAVKNSKIALYMKLVQRLCKRYNKIDFRHTPRLQNEFADALATIYSMIKHLNTSCIDPLEIYLKEQPTHCSYVEVEPDGRPWYFDIRKYLEIITYPNNATFNQKKAIHRIANNLFPSREILYRRTLDMGLLRCVNDIKAMKLLK
ncbi:uncharacterized protein LOC129890689 [Solanum dulcamara]|uniref:uncharacterized protein LOC129890689 n=1 Tax=Solanum dulcamara TaxID=45834 RepID=UPI0024857F1D|nr:uncharacterized protein LOC129890689 [Solanum dulcamara]